MPFVIVAFGLFIIFPVFTTPLNFFLAVILHDRSRYFFLVLFVLGLSMFGLYFIPNGPFDIVRYEYNLQTLQKIANPLILFDVNKINSYGYTIGLDTNVLFNFYSWVISKTNRPNLLSAGSIVTIYFSLLFPYVNQNSKLSLLKKVLLIGLTTTSLPFLYAISSIRWPMAASVYVLTTYLYFSKGQKLRHVWLLFLPVLLHSSLIILSWSTIGIALLRRRSTVTHFAVYMAGLLSFSTVITYASISSNSYLLQLVQKFNGYSETVLKTEWWVQNGTVITLLVALPILIRAAMKKNDSNNYFSEAVLFNALTYIVLFVFDKPLTDRFNWIMIPLMVIAIYLTSSPEKSYWRTMNVLIVLILAVRTNLDLFTQGFMFLVTQLEAIQVWTTNFFNYFFNG